MRCPKCKKADLEDGILEEGNFLVKYCPECFGFLIPRQEYETWQAQVPRWEPQPEILSDRLERLGENFVPSPYDTKAALCPECQSYLSRSRVSLKTPFYVERCMKCGGIWCDKGEWEILEALGLHTRLHEMFSTGWQTRIRETSLVLREREALVEKLGQELAQYIFDLAEILETHPYGDFAASYILRRFESKQKQREESEE